MALTSDPNYELHFIKYATTLYEVPKSTQEAEKYCAVVPKLKRYSKNISTFTIKFKKKGGPECGVWKEKYLVALMSNLAFDFINCVYFTAQSPREELFFFYVTD